MPNHHLGIDIQSDGITAVLLSSRLKGATVSGQWAVDYPNGQFSLENLAAAVATLSEKADIEGCESAVCIPPAWAYLRHVALPFCQKKKIDQVLSYELEPLLPVSADSAIVDYQIAAIEGERSVLLTAALEKSHLSAVMEGLTHSKLNPAILTLAGHPTAAVLQQRLKTEEHTIFAYPGLRSSTVFLFSGKQLLHARCLSEDLAAASPAQVAGCINRVVYAFQDGKTGMSFTPSRLFVAEHPAAPSAMTTELSAALGIPVEWFHPGRSPETGVSMDADTPYPEGLPTDAFSLAVCSIKGFKGLNFRKGPFALGKFWQEHRKSLVAPAIISLLILLTAGYRSVAATRYDQALLEDVNQEITQTFKAALPEVQRIVNPVLQMRTRLAELKKEAPQFDQSGRSRRVVDILRAISERISANLSVNMSQVVIGTDNVILSGDTDTFNTVNTVQQRLEQDPAFTSVSISSANQQKSGNRVNFKLRIQL